MSQKTCCRLFAITSSNVNQELVEQMHFLNFYVSHGSATRFLGGDEKYYIYFVDNLLLFPTVKEFSKSVNM